MSGGSSDLQKIQRLADALEGKHGECLPLHCYGVFRDLLNEEIVLAVLHAIDEMELQMKSRCAPAVAESLQMLAQEREERRKLHALPPESTLALPSTQQQKPAAKAQDPATIRVVCSRCNQKVAATRFAPHLVKCFGRGRAAARSAMRVMQGDEGGATDASDDDDALIGAAGAGSDDDDWKAKRKRKQTKKKTTGKKTHRVLS